MHGVQVEGKSQVEQGQFVTDHAYKLLTSRSFTLDILTYKIIQPIFLKVTIGWLKHVREILVLFSIGINGDFADFFTLQIKKCYLLDISTCAVNKVFDIRQFRSQTA